MKSPEDELLESFKKDPMILSLMKQGNLGKVAKLATSVGTAGSSPELRKYGKQLWDESQDKN
jgi:hypothetical protein